ncbi:DUF4252 domain-containing protein [Draconibacterium sp. IB214405]|uniref:DUF4252 domain-containing protein n=1 Tax=Draconibacterium sp. IB214405 TaxID=3097352 RepID=UPI002A14EB71|nr:DUF4252 domain-containing protein [Draconibacterium sp. IB214405]MDX8337953.1 DUF4252 domain-containing protein [Draconibacterium sp. IB214405]
MKTITTFLFALGLLLASLLASGQSKSDNMYDTFANKDGVTSFSFSKDMIDAIDLDLGDDDEKNVTGDLHRVRFMSYNPEKGSISNSAFTKKAIALLPSKYKKYVDDDEDSDAQIYLLGGKKKYSECHIFITNENPEGNSFIVSFYGDFNVQDIDKLKSQGKDMSE